jgi:hypothetical protein
VIPQDGVERQFTDVKSLVKAMLSYPRRIKSIKDNKDLVFEADDGMKFSITVDDFLASTREDSSVRVVSFAKAMKTREATKEWCEGINYGKPDWKEE